MVNSSQMVNTFLAYHTSFYFHILYFILTYFEYIYFAIFFFIIYFIIVYASILLLCSLLGSFIYGIRAMDGRCISFISLQKEVTRNLYYCIATTCSSIALVSLKTRLQTIVSSWSTCFLLADGQALFGWSRNGVSR